MMLIILRILPFVMLLAACSNFNNTGMFVLINKSDEQIKQAHVEISGAVFDFKKIMPQGSRTSTYQVKGDSHYDVTVYFEKGKKIQRNIGYVTNGFNYKHVIKVTKNDIVIADSEIE